MLLKKITMIGFKSFADKTEMVINQGVTALVGPNGCGKSNLVDAIRWVLGEQRIKNLRGGKSEDVIFHGCVTRKSTGMAEVTLTFDNSDGSLPIDFNEVSITRRLYRSGESQYLINKTQCRLKDVHRMFMDTGVGTSTYSIIEQGQMDWIVNAKAEERRTIFEEAAGITKYKVKRKEALRKLNYAEDNLTRLKDIISELESRIQSLSRQASKARRYKSLTEELRFLDCQYTLKKYQDLKSALENNINLLKEGETELEKLKESINNEESSNHDALQLINELENTIKEETEQKFTFENKLDQLHQAIEFNNSRIKDIKTRLEASDSDKDSYQQKFNELETLQEKLLNERKEMEETRKNSEETVDLKNQTINAIISRIEQKKNFIYEFKEKLEELSVSSSETQKKILEFSILEKSIDQQIDKQSDEISDIQLSINFEDDQLAAAKDKAEEHQKYHDEIAAKVVNKEQEIKASSYSLQQMESRMLKTSQELSEKSSRKDALEDLKNSYEGFFSGVRAIMLNKNENHEEWSDIIGVVPDIIKVHEGYEIAAEVALGSRIQNIITKTAETAKKAIHFLKSHKLGRVTFIPLDMMRDKELKSFNNDGRILGRLNDFIDYDMQYDKAMHSLLGNFLVSRNIDDAIAIMKSGLRGFNIVTIEGELISGSGAITGGEIKTGVKGIFSRENEIDGLVSEINNLRDRIIKNNEERSKLKNSIETDQNTLENLRIERNQANYDYHNSEKEYQKAQLTRDNLQKRLDILNAEIDKAYEKKEQLDSEREQLSTTLNSSSEEDSSIRETITKYEKELEEAYDELTEEKELLGRDKVNLTNMEEKAGSLDLRLSEIKNEIKERKEWLDNISISFNQQTKLIQELEEQNTNSLREIEVLKERKSQLEEQIALKDQQLIKLKENTRNFEELRRNCQNEIDKLHSQDTELKVKIAESEGRLNNYQEHLYAKYQVRIDDVTEEREKIETSWDEIPEKIERIDQKIRNLGNVNLTAIEELEKQQERFDYLTSQEKDLNAAKNQLNEVIEKINITATEMFQETFDKVKVYFNDIFTELFQGGKAELKILNHDDILEAGIDIVARPAGKNFQTISLLSGGEKALTATALLFALFKVKPSPFCFIDELDAPLDDTNIGRFTKMLKGFALSTQFIVITHNKNTLNIADLLYGVTQPEKGISKLISVKFIDEDLDHLLEEPKSTGKLPVKNKQLMLKEEDPIVSMDLPTINSVRLNLPGEETESPDNKLSEDNDSTSVRINTEEVIEHNDSEAASLTE